MEMRYLAQVFDKLVTPGEVADACIPNEKAKRLHSGEEIVKEAPKENVLRLSQKMEGLIIGLHEVARLMAPASQELTALATLGVDKVRDVFYDLGSGNGKVVFLVEKLSGAKTKGFEQTLWTHWWAKLKGLIIQSRAEFVNRNFFKTDWAGGVIKVPEDLYD